jgi:methylated-DNA-[protein]-cysteine S-methyltransferase
LVASDRGVSRVELWDRPPPRWRSLREGSCERGGPPNAVLDQAIEELDRYFRGERVTFRTPLDLGSPGASFQRRVWDLLGTIPYGETWSYIDLACRAGSERAARAAGQAVGRNPLAVVLPCHRVVGAGGRLTGFGSGLRLKIALLRIEGVPLSGGAKPEDVRVLDA